MVVWAQSSQRATWPRHGGAMLRWTGRCAAALDDRYYLEWRSVCGETHGPSPAASAAIWADVVQLPCRDRQQRIAAGEQPALRATLQPPRSEQIEQLRREHRVPVLAALALL